MPDLVRMPEFDVRRASRNANRPCRAISLQMDDAASKADRHRLRAILCTELAHDAPDVDLDRFLRDRQALCYISVAVAFGDQSQHVQLPCCDASAAQVLREVGGRVARQVPPA